MSSFLNLILLLSLFSVVFAQQTPHVPTDTNDNTSGTRTIAVVMIVIGTLILASCIWDIVRRVKNMRKKMMAQNVSDGTISETADKMSDNPTQSPAQQQQQKQQDHHLDYYS